MRKVKFLHFSDLHLDMPFSSLGLESNRSFIRRQDLKEVFKRIINLARDEKVDMILIGGDLYEHDYVRKSTINFINDRFKEISDIKVFIIPGNHDPYTADSYYRNYKWSSNVFILSSSNPCVSLDNTKVRVYGAGLEGRYRDCLDLDGIGPVDPEFINILLLHGTVDMNFKKGMYNPVESSRLDSLGMDYIALGHFHRQFKGLGSKGRIYNPGSPEPLGFDEIGEHGILIGTITKYDNHQTSVDISTISVNERNYREVQVNINSCNNDEQVIKKIVDTLKDKDKDKTLYRIVLKGYTEKGFRADIQQITSFLRENVFFVKIIDESTPDYDFDVLREEPGLKGLFVKKVLSLIEKSGDERHKRVLEKALYFGLEALEEGEVKIRQE